MRMSPLFLEMFRSSALTSSLVDDGKEHVSTSHKLKDVTSELKSSTSEEHQPCELADETREDMSVNSISASEGREGSKSDVREGDVCEAVTAEVSADRGQRLHC